MALRLLARRALKRRTTTQFPYTQVYSSPTAIVDEISSSLRAFSTTTTVSKQVEELLAKFHGFQCSRGFSTEAEAEAPPRPPDAGAEGGGEDAAKKRRRKKQQQTISPTLVSTPLASSPAAQEREFLPAPKFPKLDVTSKHRVIEKLEAEDWVRGGGQGSKVVLPPHYSDPQKVFQMLQHAKPGSYSSSEKARLSWIFHRFSESGLVRF